MKKKSSALFLAAGSFLRRVSIFGASGAIVVAFMGLLGYVPGLEVLGNIRQGYIPMAPSTAISFIVLGGILLAMTVRSPSGASSVFLGVLAAIVSFFGLLEVADHFTGKDMNFEDVLVPAAGYLGNVPIARMSPSTGALFFLAGIAVFVLILQRSRAPGQRTLFGHWGGGLGTLALGIGLVFCLAYFYGSPLLYGQGTTVPMALTTALAFLMLGAAVVGVSGDGVIPVSLLVGVIRTGNPMNARRRFLFLGLIMIGACATVMTIMAVMLYRHNVHEQRNILQVTAQSQARLIEAVARYDANVAGLLRDVDPGHDSAAATLSQITDAHDQYEGFGETGEFSLARREGDSIVYILRHRHGEVEHPLPVSFDSDLAEPMRRALKGLSGTVISLDYRGATVLAAHEPVGILNLGIVAKIDMSEIRAPFIRSGLTAAAIAFLVVLAGTGMFFRVSNPIIARLKAYSKDLEKEITERKQAEEALRESEERLRLTLETVSDGGWDWNLVTDEVFFSDHWLESLGYTRDEVEPHINSWKSIVHPDDKQKVMKTLNAHFEGQTSFYECENRLRMKSGEYRWNLDRGKVVVRDPDGKPLRMVGADTDITERKQAKEELLRYAHIVSSSSDMIAMLDTKFVYLAANEAYLTAFDMTKDKVIGHTVSEVFGEEFFETIITPNAERCLAGDTIRYENWFQFPAMGSRFMSISYSPHIGPDGDIKGFIVNGRDITERKKAEEECETTIELLRLLNDKNNLHELIRTILRFMKEISGCEAVGIRLRDGDDFPYCETSGFSDEFVEAERHLCVSDLNGQLQRDEIGNPVLECMCGNIICGRFDPSTPFFTDYGSFISNCTSELLASTTEEDRQSRTRNRCNAEGYESV